MNCILLNKVSLTYMTFQIKEKNIFAITAIFRFSSLLFEKFSR